MTKCLVILITKDHVHPKCWESVLQQDYPNYDAIIHQRKPKVATTEADNQSTQEIIKKYVNCSDNREAARKLALASDAERFLFVDSDIIIPPHTIREMVRQPYDVQGGYYLVAGSDRYTVGRWVGDNKFWNLREVEPDLTRVDCVGMGCAMLSRRALEAVTFEHGTDRSATTWIEGLDVPMLLGECGILGIRLEERGFELWANGSVVCEHLEESAVQVQLGSNVHHKRFNMVLWGL